MGAIEAYRAQFLEHTGAWRGREPSWVTALRREAFERFLDRGFPTTRDEEWRFTNVGPLAAMEFTPAAVGDESRASSLLKAHLPDGWRRHEIVLVNGRFAPALSRLAELPPGVVVAGIDRALTTHPEELEEVLAVPLAERATVFADLNRAFLGRGAFVLVPENTVLDDPIHVVHLSTAARPEVSHPCTVLLARAGSAVRLVESYLGEEGSIYFTNSAADVVAADGSNVDHYRIQRESVSSFHVGSQRILQSRGAFLQNHSLSLGGKLSRNDIYALLDGEGADLTLNGLYVVRGTQHVDHHTVIDHKEPHGTSRELYKGVLDDASSGVFNGRIIVRRGAQKTNAQQTNKNLLLSQEALVNTNPQLEINADDVRCAHGATIGQLDKDALFYLRTRGIDQEEARKILTRAFMADVSDRIRIVAVREAMRRFVLAEAA